MLVEFTEWIIAEDSIPAVFGISADPFLAFTSNVFAIPCLRSLYFVLAGLITIFRYLKPSLSLILILVDVKMLAAKWLKVWLGESFNLTVLAVLATGIVTSILVSDRKDESENAN